MDSFWQAVAELTQNVAETVKIEYRVYYDEHGKILFYTMEDVPGTYLVIDRETYEQSRYDAVVKNNKLIKTNAPSSWKLAPDDEGTPCHPSNVCIVVDARHEPNTKWTVKVTDE
jgi:hypothetical protein